MKRHSVEIFLVCACAMQDAPAPPRTQASSTFVSISRVVYASSIDRPHRLEAVYAGPEKIRWSRTLVGGSPSARDVEYRSGSLVFRLDQLASASTRAGSRELRGSERDEALRRMDLRRAALAWPEGVQWQVQDHATTAPLEERLEDGTVRSLGRMTAGDFEDGRPRRFEVWTERDESQEALLVTGWRDEHGRRIPSELTLEVDGTAVWHETVERIDWNPRFLDAFFLPSDRRGETRVSGDIRFQSADLVRITYRCFDLPEDSSWESAVASFDRERAAAEADLTPLGFALDRVPTFELSPEGAPRSGVLRLGVPTDEPPKGWTTLPERPGLLGRVGRVELITAELLRRLTEGAPGNPRCGTPYARWISGSDGSFQTLHLAVPFETQDER